MCSSCCLLVLFSNFVFFFIRFHQQGATINHTVSEIEDFEEKIFEQKVFE